ncbi:MAG: hypothetical protein LC730_02465 [Acidobacteria bacterium]|nr:hypothetical protein [Acidobacteriota bacterium]MCA1608306.1 hypothetical protein [Acidobacteriota bacterium]
MQKNTAVKFAPIFSEERKIDVSLVNGDAIIRLSSWVEGLGWCAQKTMQLDPELLEELHRVISAARMRLKNDDDKNSTPVDSKVLRFPTMA